MNGKVLPLRPLPMLHLSAFPLVSLPLHYTLGDGAVAQMVEIGGKVGGGWIMRCHQDCHRFVVYQGAQQTQDLLSRLAVQVAGRLVGQNEPRADGKRAGDGNSLLLPATQLVGPMVDPGGQAHRRNAAVVGIGAIALHPVPIPVGIAIVILGNLHGLGFSFRGIIPGGLQFALRILHRFARLAQRCSSIKFDLTLI